LSLCRVDDSVTIDGELRGSDGGGGGEGGKSHDDATAEGGGHAGNTAGCRSWIEPATRGGSSRHPKWIHQPMSSSHYCTGVAHGGRPPPSLPPDQDE
jgi:hypothetical protein